MRVMRNYKPMRVMRVMRMRNISPRTEILQGTKSCATRYYDIHWHCKNNEVIQETIIG